MSCFAHAEKLKTPSDSPINFDFQFVNVAQVVNLIYGEALKVPYVLSPDLLLDNRTVSFRYEASKGDLKPFLNNFLDSLGYSVTDKNGIQYISKKLIDELTEKLTPDKLIFVYVPKFRDVGYLTRLISPLFAGSFTTSKSIQAPLGSLIDKKVPENSAAGLIDQTADTLIFSGSEKEVLTLKNLLPQIDIKQGEVMVKGVLYEVSSSNKEGSAMALALDILGSKFGLSLGGAKTLDSFVKFKNKSIDFVFSALATDSRFKVVSTPSLRVRSGSTGTFTVGQDVPVLGSINYQGTGNAVQSVEYKSSGVIFNVTPTDGRCGVAVPDGGARGVSRHGAALRA